MAFRKIVCPELIGVARTANKTVLEWGLIEYLEDLVLPHALDTAEGCEMAIRVLKQTKGKRGAAQVGHEILLSTPDWAALCAYVKRPREWHEPENLTAAATYNRAVLLAVEVADPAETPATTPAASDAAQPTPKRAKGRRK